MSEETKLDNKIEFGNLYDVNKSLVEQVEKPMSKSALREKKQSLINYMISTNNKYYMLLCHEKRDYTIFKTNQTVEGNKYNIDVLVDEIAGTRGLIKGIDLDETSGSFEFWISIDGEAFVYMFFPCDTCVIDEVV